MTTEECARRDVQIERLQKRIIDRRTRAYRSGLKQITHMSDEKVARRTRSLSPPRVSLKKTASYRAYLKDRAEIAARVAAENRRRLDAILRDVDARRTIVITHERQFRCCQVSEVKVDSGPDAKSWRQNPVRNQVTYRGGKFGLTGICA